MLGTRCLLRLLTAPDIFEFVLEWDLDQPQGLFSQRATHNGGQTLLPFASGGRGGGPCPQWLNQGSASRIQFWRLVSVAVDFTHLSPFWQIGTHVGVLWGPESQLPSQMSQPPRLVFKLFF